MSSSFIIINIVGYDDHYCFYNNLILSNYDEIHVVVLNGMLFYCNYYTYTFMHELFKYFFTQNVKCFCGLYNLWSISCISLELENISHISIVGMCKRNYITLYAYLQK